MKLLAATIALTALTGFAMIHPAEARCFWNGFDMEWPLSGAAPDGVPGGL